MFKVEALDEVENAVLPYATVLCTHKKTSLAYLDPENEVPLRITVQKGVLVDGKFVPVPGAMNEEQSLDKQGYADLLADTSNGKPADVFRTTDILPAIAKRQAAVAAAAAAVIAAEGVVSEEAANPVK